jgi:hypothetical protein
MTSRRTTDDAIRDWLRSGPETASSELVTQTLRPVRRMRQRRSWRIAVDRVAGPSMRLAGIAAVLAIAIGTGLLLLRPGGLGDTGVGSGPSPAASRPSFRMEVTGGPGAGTYLSVPATNLSMCSKAADGSWRLMYVAGSPDVNLDMLVGSRAGQPGGSSDVAVEVEYGAGYVRFDPADLRGGDPAGRSTATITVMAAAGGTTFAITATTPDRSTGSDGPPVHVDLTVTCPS